MKGCWASSLGDCSAQISREHTVSASLFLEDKITVHGFHWCADKPVEIGLSSLTQKILCTHHTNILSPVDQAGADAFEKLREMTRIRNVRAKLRGPFRTVLRYEVDGLRLERWFLKTLINICSDRELAIGNSSILGRPTDHLAKVAFGLEGFEENEGLYSLSKPGMETTWEDRLSFKALYRKDSYLEGGIFFFRGLCFLLWFGVGEPPKDFSGLSFMGLELKDLTLMRHLKRVCDGTKQQPSQILSISWN